MLNINFYLKSKFVLYLNGEQFAPAGVNPIERFRAEASKRGLLHNTVDKPKFLLGNIS